MKYLNFLGNNLRRFYLYQVLLLFGIVAGAVLIRPEIILIWNSLYAFSALEEEYKIIYFEKGYKTLDNLPFRKRYVIKTQVLLGCINLICSNLLTGLVLYMALYYDTYLISRQFYLSWNIKYIMSVMASVIFWGNGLIVYQKNRPNKAFVIWVIINCILLLFAYVLFRLVL